MQKLIEQCTQCPDEAELAKAAKAPGQRAFLQRVNALEFAMTGQPLSGGNRSELLLDGPATHRAQLEAIAKAQHHVHLITYIMTDDKLAHEYLQALSERRRQGVQVRLMFDGLGGRTVGPEYRDALARAGIEVRAFGDPREHEALSISRRHHRKMLVVDGKVAFTGGINISDEYRASSAGSGSRNGGWRDTNVRIDGPAVALFQKLFFASWEDGHDPIPPDDAYWPKLRRRGNDFVRVVAQEGKDLHELVFDPVTELAHPKREHSGDEGVYGSYLAAIASARSRLWITQAYFMPNKEFMKALTDAARRGVDVRVLVPSMSDIQLMVHASRFHYAPLLEAGARVWEYSGPMLHSKTAIVDGVWATVGSSNLDYRSFIHNDEANAIIMGDTFGAKMERMFLDDLAKAREMTRAEWAQRGWIDRLRQRSAVLLKYWI